MKNYSDQQAWNEMTLLKELDGTEIRVDPESGRFAYWRRDELRRLKHLADAEREIRAARRAVRAIATGTDWDEVSPPAVCDIVGREGDRWRYGTGDLSSAYSRRHYVWTADLEARLRDLAQRQAEAKTRYDQEQEALREERNQALAGADLLTAERWAELRKAQQENNPS